MRDGNIQVVLAGAGVGVASQMAGEATVAPDLRAALSALPGDRHAVLVIDAAMFDQAMWAVRQPEVANARVLVVAPDRDRADQFCGAEHAARCVVCVTPVDAPDLFATLIRRFSTTGLERLLAAAARPRPTLH